MRVMDSSSVSGRIVLSRLSSVDTWLITPSNGRGAEECGRGGGSTTLSTATGGGSARSVLPRVRTETLRGPEERDAETSAEAEEKEGLWMGISGGGCVGRLSF